MSWNALSKVDVAFAQALHLGAGYELESSHLKTARINPYF